MKLKKILFPLATLVAAGAIAVGSGATFTSTSANTISSVTSGTLSQSNSKNDAAILTVANIKPGDTVKGAVTITNTGSLPASFTLATTQFSNTFSDKLTLTITDETTKARLFSGPVHTLAAGAKTPLGTFAPKAAHTYTFAATLDATADNTDQDKTATAAFVWDSVQLNGSTTDVDAPAATN